LAAGRQHVSQPRLNDRADIPDVALTAENIYVIYNNGSAHAFGGTSCAAPLWAGFMALVNQQAAATAGRPPASSTRPFYALAQGPFYGDYFHDTTMAITSTTAV